MPSKKAEKQMKAIREQMRNDWDEKKSEFLLVASISKTWNHWWTCHAGDDPKMVWDDEIFLLLHKYIYVLTLARSAHSNTSWVLSRSQRRSRQDANNKERRARLQRWVDFPMLWWREDSSHKTFFSSILELLKWRLPFSASLPFERALVAWEQCS